MRLRGMEFSKVTQHRTNQGPMGGLIYHVCTKGSDIESKVPQIAAFSDAVLTMGAHCDQGGRGREEREERERRRGKGEREGGREGGGGGEGGRERGEICCMQ